MGIPFHEEELQVVSQAKGYGGVTIQTYHTPVTAREAMKRLFRREPVWQNFGAGVEYHPFCPSVNPDNIARAYVLEAGVRRDDPRYQGGRDMFGVLWEYEPVAGGSMVRPGNYPFADADEMLRGIAWPDIDSWDWEESARKNANYFSQEKFNICWFMNGWYERLISLMGFENAAMAMIDDEQTDDVMEFFNKLTDLYIRIVDKYLTYYPMIDGFYIHDDWGGQQDTFFSPATAKEMIVPYMRRLTDFIHSKGRFCDLHSCGQNFRQVPNYIAAGWDAWRPQSMNDVAEIYRLYGDKIILAIPPEPFDPETTSEEEQRAAARAYAEKYCDPDKPTMFSIYGSAMLTPAFQEELYRQSRLRYQRCGEACGK